MRYFFISIWVHFSWIVLQSISANFSSWLTFICFRNSIKVAWKSKELLINISSKSTSFSSVHWNSIVVFWSIEIVFVFSWSFSRLDVCWVYWIGLSLSWTFESWRDVAWLKSIISYDSLLSMFNFIDFSSYWSISLSLNSSKKSVILFSSI